MEQKANPFVSDLNYQSKPKRVLHVLLPKLVVGAVLLVIVILVFVVIDIHRNNESKSGICSTSLIKQSYANIVINDNGSLANNVSTIKGISNYQHDPNCMYIVTIYDIHTLNASGAQSSLALLNKYYNGKNLSPLLQQYASVSTLKELVSSLNNTQQQDLSNFEKLSPKAEPRKAKS